MTDLPTLDSTTPEGRQKRKAELEALNQAADQASGRVLPIGQRWEKATGNESGLSQKTRNTLDASDPMRPRESQLHKPESEAMKARQDQFDKIVKERPAPRAVLPILSMEERIRAWHRSIGSPQRVVDYELAQLKEGKK